MVARAVKVSTNPVVRFSAYTPWIRPLVEKRIWWRPMMRSIATRSGTSVILGWAAAAFQRLLHGKPRGIMDMDNPPVRMAAFAG